MNDLISVVSRPVGSENIQTVNARELHSFLEVGRDFSTWIKDRISQFGFSENSDFVCSPISVSEGRGGQNRVDYHLSLDMAKELSMVERNDKGKQARQYFIECERKAKSMVLHSTDPLIASLQALQVVRQQQIDHDKRITMLEAQNTTRDTSYFTVAGYGRLLGMSLNQVEAAQIGRKCARLALSLNSPIKDEYDSRWGKVNSYHRAVLDVVFEQ